MAWLGTGLVCCWAGLCVGLDWTGLGLVGFVAGLSFISLLLRITFHGICSAFFIHALVSSFARLHYMFAFLFSFLLSSSSVFFPFLLSSFFCCLLSSSYRSSIFLQLLGGDWQSRDAADCRALQHPRRQSAVHRRASRTALAAAARVRTCLRTCLCAREVDC